MRHPFIQPGGILLRRQQRMSVRDVGDVFDLDTLHLAPDKGLKLASGEAEDWADIRAVGQLTATQDTADDRPTPGTAPVHLDFDATDFLNIPDDSLLQIDNGENFSIMFAFRRTAGAGSPMTIGNPGEQTAGSVGFIGFDTFSDATGGGRIAMRVRDSTATPVLGAFLTGIDNAWCVFSGTFNWSGDMSFYRDGGTPGTMDVSSLTGDLWDSAATNGLTIGKHNDESGGLQARIADVVFDRRSWTAGQHNARGRDVAGRVGATWVDVS